MIRPMRTNTFRRKTLVEVKWDAAESVEQITWRGDDVIRIEYAKEPNGYVAHVDWCEGDTA